MHGRRPTRRLEIRLATARRTVQADRGRDPENTCENPKTKDRTVIRKTARACCAAVCFCFVGYNLEARCLFCRSSWLLLLAVGLLGALNLLELVTKDTK